MKCEYDIPYHPACLMDIYFPDTAAPADGYPCVLVIHGGGWFVGDKADERQVQISETFAQHGYMVYNINYTMAEQREHAKNDEYVLNALTECKHALLWIRAHSREHQTNPQRIAAIGGSAGGNMSLMLGLTAGNADFEPPSINGDTSIRAVINLYAPVTWPIALEVLPHIDANCLPILSIHGTADTTVPVEEAHKLDAALAAVGVEHQLIIVDDAPHTFNLDSQWGDYRETALQFLDKHLSTQAAKS